MYKIIFLFVTILDVGIIYAQNSDKFTEKPSWSADFSNIGRPDEKTWSYEIGMRGEELEYYTSSKKNVYVRNGKLVINAIRDNTKDKAVCTSGRIHTRGKVSFLYGKIEVRAKIPVGKGIFPAIWFLNVSHPKYPSFEIDMMEYIDCWNKKEIQSNVFVDTWNNEKVLSTQFPKRVSLNTSKYHIYTLEWYKDRLVFLLDGKKYHEYRKDQSSEWHFNQPAFLIINVAYGGWGGSCGMDKNIFPKSMKIDWIRYYKLKE